MLGVQTYYARAASPTHLLYPLTLHTTSSYLLYLIESRSITIQDNKKARKKKIAIALGASRGRKVIYDTGELRFYPASASRMGRGRELSTHALCFSPLVKD